MPLIPALYAFRPWSHTDKRMMLMLMSDPVQSVAELNVPASQVLRLHEMSEAQWYEAHEIDKPIRDRMLTPDAPKVWPYLSVSWSSRAPSKLRIHSIQFMLRFDCHNWTDFISKQEGQEGRTFFVAELLDPEAAKVSP